MGRRKSGKLNTEDIAALANDKPVVYKVENAQGTNIYTGVAKRGRVQERITEHLPGAKDAIPGGKRVTIDQKSSIEDALASEERIIKRAKPKHNKEGK